MALSSCQKAGKKHEETHQSSCQKSASQSVSQSSMHGFITSVLVLRAMHPQVSIKLKPLYLACVFLQIEGRRCPTWQTATSPQNAHRMSSESQPRAKTSHPQPQCRPCAVKMQTDISQGTSGASWHKQKRKRAPDGAP